MTSTSSSRITVASRLEVIPGAEHDGITMAQVDAVIPLLVEYFANGEP